MGGRARRAARPRQKIASLMGVWGMCECAWARLRANGGGRARSCTVITRSIGLICAVGCLTSSSARLSSPGPRGSVPERHPGPSSSPRSPLQSPPRATITTPGNVYRLSPTRPPPLSRARRCLFVFLFFMLLIVLMLLMLLMLVLLLMMMRLLTVYYTHLTLPTKLIL